MRHVSASVFFIVIILLIVIPPAAEAGTGKIIGKIFDAETGEWLKGVSVYVIGTDHRETTDRNGRFAIDSLVAGWHELLFVRKGYKTEKAEVTVTTETVRHIFHVLEPASVRYASKTRNKGFEKSHICGTLADSASGEPVIGANVMLVGTHRGAMSDFDGYFIIRNVEPGTYEIKISHLDYRMVLVPDVIVKPGSYVALWKKLTKMTAEETDAVITVRSEPEVLAIRGGPIAVAGLRDTMQGVTVVREDDSLAKTGDMVTNARGEVFVRGGRAGEVAYVVEGGPGPTAGLGQAGANLVLPTSHRISGSVMDDNSKQPLRNVTVIVIGTNYRAVTDATGKFEIKDIPSGSYEILLSCNGYNTSKVGEVSVGSKTTTGLRFELEKLTEK